MKNEQWEEPKAEAYKQLKMKENDIFEAKYLECQERDHAIYGGFKLHVFEKNGEKYSLIGTTTINNKLEGKEGENVKVKYFGLRDGKKGQYKLYDVRVA